MSAAECLLVQLPGVSPDWHSLEGKKVWRTVRRLGAYREGRCQGGLVPRGAFVKA